MEGVKEFANGKYRKNTKKAADFNTSKEDSVEVVQKNQWEAKPPNIN